MPRAIIPNDYKLFAQADLDKSVSHFVTSDLRSNNTLNMLKKEVNPKFEIINIPPLSESHLLRQASPPERIMIKFLAVSLKPVIGHPTSYIYPNNSITQ